MALTSFPGQRFILAGLLSLVAVLQATADHEFREIVPDEDYVVFEKQLDPERLNVAKALAEKRPPYGALIEAVEEGGQAAQAGLGPGWVVESYNGKLFIDHTLSMKPGGSDGLSRKTVVFSPDGQVKTLDFAPGRIGFTLGNWIHPEKFVLEATPRGAWDHAMLLASEAWIRGRHDIAETALAKARALGMPDNPISRYYGALLALDRGEDREAQARWSEWMKDIGDGAISPFYLAGARAYAWHYQDFGLLRRTLETDSFIPTRIQPSTIDAWAKVAGDPAVSLLESAVRRAGKDLMSTVVSVPDEIWKNWKLVPAKWLHPGWTAVPGTAGESMTYHFMPKQPVGNALWEITLAVGNAEPPRDAPPNSVVFAMMDRSQKGGDPLNISSKRVISFSALQHADGARLVGFGGGIQEGTLYTQRVVPWLTSEQATAVVNTIENNQRPAKPAADKVIHLTFIRIGNEAELLVNGQRWSRMSVPESVKDLGFFFQVVGTVVVIDRMTLYQL